MIMLYKINNNKGLNTTPAL